MTNEITLDDLAAPEISDRGREILAERAAIPVEFSLQGILKFANETTDVPIHQDDAFFHSLERFLLEGDQRGELTDAGKKLLAADLPTWSFSAVAWKRYSPNMIAAHFLYGTLGAMLKPDLRRTDFVLVIGANPYVAHSSLITEPLLREACTEVKERNGRVVVVDPRRTETARRNEHVPINAGTDAWLLSAMLNTIITEDLGKREWAQQNVEGLEEFLAEMNSISPELAAGHTGIAADDIRQLARDFAKAGSACVIARTSTCTQQFGTLCCLLRNILCVVTGNIDSEGGMSFGEGLIDFSQIVESMGADTFGTRPSMTPMSETSAPRAAAFAWNTKPIYRQQENWFLSLNNEVLENASDKLLTLLGYPTEVLGTVYGHSPC